MPVFSVGADQDPLDEGQYPAFIKSIESAIIDPNNPPKFDKPQSIVTWELTEIEHEDGTPFTRRQYVNDVRALTPKSNWYGLFSTLLCDGQLLDKEAQYSTDDLIGKHGVIFWGAYVGADGTSKMKILKVSPPKKAVAAATSGVRRKAVEDANAEVAAAIDAI